METASQVQNGQRINCSSKIENTSGEKLELGSSPLPSEHVDTMIVDSVAQNCQKIGNSILEKNTSNGNIEMGSNHVSSESIDIRTVRFEAEEKCQIIEKSISIENTLGGTPESDSNFVIGEATETMTANSGGQNCQTRNFCCNEVSSEFVQVERMETTTVGSDFADIRFSGTETITICPVAQTCQTTGSSILEQKTSDENHDMSSHMSSEPMETIIVGSDVEEKCHINGSSIIERNTLRENSEHDSERVVQSEHVAQNCQTAGNLILDHNTSDGNRDMSSEGVSSEPMEITIVGSDEEKCHISVISISEGHMPGEKSEHDSELVGQPMGIRTSGTNLQNFQTVDSCHNKLCSELVQGQPVDIRIVGSDSVDVGLSGTVTMKVTSVAQNCQIIGGSLKQNTSDEVGSENVSSEPMDIMIVGSHAKEKSDINGKLISEEDMPEGNPEHHSKLVLSDPMETRTAVSSKHSFQTLEGEAIESRIVGPGSVDVRLSGTSPPPMNATEESSGPGNKESNASSGSKKRKSVLGFRPATARVLRPRLNGLCKTPDPSGSSANVSEERTKARKKRKRIQKAMDDEYSRTKKRLRYLLSRMGYEHNFIEAYSGEGWRGQSVEKIKPEKELQRAASEILRCKRRIRELFQHLDSSCAEGRFQESLFDSDGQISSEDIFCAKCGRTDLSADNDIILCDGICDRGFHQMCLVPPLLKEEIPPGDEGWLCPGCDCKVDCIDLLNDSQGTHLSINDNWEKVFPEAAATAAGDLTDCISALPSDDSEDYEYNPDAPEVEKEVHAESSSSEDSEGSEDSEDSEDSGDSEDSEDSGDSEDSEDSGDSDDKGDDLMVHPVYDQYLGLPSDDSEDDEYDPNAPNTEETSSSDTSAAEYFSASDTSDSPGTADGPVHSSVDDSKLPVTSNRRSKVASNNRESVNSELMSILESDNLGDPSPVSGKRQREQLDYKKLHDETYGNVSSDSSDDEDWDEAESPSKKDDGAGKESLLSPKATSRTITSRRNTKGLQKRDSKETRSTLKRNTRGNSEGTSKSSAETHVDNPEPDLIGKSTAPSYKTLGEAVTQRLYESFSENNYPTRAIKENLAKELGITVRQTTKWFENARWSLRQQTNDSTDRTKKAAQTKDQTPTKLVVPETKIPEKNTDNNEARENSETDTSKIISNLNAGVDKDHQTTNEASSTKKKVEVPPTKEEAPSNLVKSETKILPENQESIEATPKSSRKRKDVNLSPDCGTLDGPSSTDRTLVVSIPANSPKTEQGRKRGRKSKANQVAATQPQSQIQTRSRRSAQKEK